MINTSLTPPVIDQATIDRAIARGKRERSRIIFAMFRGLFRAPAAPAMPAPRAGNTRAAA